MDLVWDNYMTPPKLQEGIGGSALADVLSKPVSFRPFKNCPCVKTKSLGLDVHMESSGGAPHGKGFVRVNIFGLYCEISQLFIWLYLETNIVFSQGHMQYF